MAADEPPKRPPVPLNSPPSNAVVNAVIMQGKETREMVEDIDNRLTTLEEQKLPSRVAYIYTQQQKVERTVTRMTDILDGIVKEGAQNGCWDWSQFDQEQAAEAWELILRWRREVFQARWPKEHRKTALPCWYMHPTVVEAMSALYTSWDWTFHHKSSNPTRVTDWLRYTLPGMCDLIADEVNGCKIAGQHKPPVELGPNQLDDGEHLSMFVKQDLQARPLAPPKDVPAPTG